VAAQYFVDTIHCICNRSPCVPNFTLGRGLLSGSFLHLRLDLIHLWLWCCRLKPQRWLILLWIVLFWDCFSLIFNFDHWLKLQRLRFQLGLDFQRQAEAHFLCQNDLLAVINVYVAFTRLQSAFPFKSWVHK
jgi:hypothetical protein